MLFYHCGKGVVRWAICTSQCNHHCTKSLKLSHLHHVLFIAPESVCKNCHNILPGLISLFSTSSCKSYFNLEVCLAFILHPSIVALSALYLIAHSSQLFIAQLYPAILNQSRPYWYRSNAPFPSSLWLINCCNILDIKTIYYAFIHVHIY